MPRDYIPSRESDFVTWSANFAAKIIVAPSTLGLVPAQAVGYGALNTAFAAAYATANDPATRSPSNIVAKNMAMEALKENARELARIIQAYPAITPEQISELGLTVRDSGGSPINPPADAPKMDIVSAVVRTVKIRLHDAANPTRRGKPEGVSGASIFSYVGATPPAEIAAWKFEGSTTRTVVDVEFDPSVASGATVWLTAFWFNPRSQSGPACAPVSTNLPGGAVMAA
jgi:hypothetical protein